MTTTIVCTLGSHTLYKSSLMPLYAYSNAGGVTCEVSVFDVNMTAIILSERFSSTTENTTIT